MHRWLARSVHAGRLRERILLPLNRKKCSISLLAFSVDGQLVVTIHGNGPLDRIRTCQSTDDGLTWGVVGTMDFPNPGSGLDGVRLANGHWELVYNDTLSGRNSLAVSMSLDEGRTWPVTRHLERHDAGSYHYPAMIQSADGMIHVVFSYFVEGGKSMKHATFNEDWIQAPETP